MPFVILNPSVGTIHRYDQNLLTSTPPETSTLFPLYQCANALYKGTDVHARVSSHPSRVKLITRVAWHHLFSFLPRRIVPLSLSAFFLGAELRAREKNYRASASIHCCLPLALPRFNDSAREEREIDYRGVRRVLKIWLFAPLIVRSAWLQVEW